MLVVAHCTAHPSCIAYPHGGLQAPTDDTTLKLEVGIEDALHIEFEYDHSAYALADIVTGRVAFLLTRIRIKTMEVALIKRETIGRSASGSQLGGGA